MVREIAKIGGDESLRRHLLSILRRRPFRLEALVESVWYQRDREEAERRERVRLSRDYGTDENSVAEGWEAAAVREAAAEAAENGDADAPIHAAVDGLKDDGRIEDDGNGRLRIRLDPAIAAAKSETGSGTAAYAALRCAEIFADPALAAKAAALLVAMRSRGRFHVMDLPGGGRAVAAVLA